MTTGFVRHHAARVVDTSLTVPPTAPGVPTHLTASTDKPTEIDLTWTAPTDAGSTPISGYQVERLVQAGLSATWETVVGNTNSTATNYTHTGLMPDISNRYRVRAINDTGAGLPSATATGHTAGTPPGAPTGLTATAYGVSAIDLSWRAPADTGSSAIANYRIEVSSNAGTDWDALVWTGGGRDYTHTGLQPSTTRHYRVFAGNQAGAGPASNVASATTASSAAAPGAPTGLMATDVDVSEIELAWTAPADTGTSAITGYRIEVSSDAGQYWADLVANTGDTGEEYTHKGLQPNTTRHYRVSAINASGAGPPSNVASATTASSAAEPGAPTGLTATDVDVSEIELAWTAPADTGTSAITGYRIEVSRNAGQSWADLVANTGDTGDVYSHKGLQPGTTRHYRVSAINASGAGPASNVASATTGGSTGTPGVPTGLTATADSSEIELEWTAPADTGTSAITGYRIEVSRNAGQSWNDRVSNTGNTVTTYTHTGLQPGTTRHYRVSAINASGAGPASNVASATTGGSTGTPGVPTGLTATADSSEIELEWTAPADTGTSAITGYRIEVSRNAGQSWNDRVSNTGNTVTTYTHTGLQPGTTRHYRVSAINGAGTGSPSAVANATTTEDRTPARPTNLRAMADGDSAIHLSWTAPTDTGTSAISGYRIEVSSNAGQSWNDRVSNTGSAGVQYTHRALQPGTTRHYRVSAINSTGTGRASVVASATTVAVTVLGAPTGLVATARGQSQIQLVWTPPSDDGGSAITGYRMEVSEDGGANWTVLTANTGSAATAYSHTGLTPVSTRHYRVSAINTVGIGPASNVAHATTEASPPGPPTNLTATANGTSRIDLFWTAPADDGGVPVTGYRIQVLTADDPVWSALVDHTGSMATTYSHTGLEPASTWNYRVFAINVAGAGLESEAASATTEATLPDAPADLTARARGESWIELAWNAPAFTGGVPITGYKIEVYDSDGALWTVLVAGTRTNATTYHHLGLDPGTTRYYRVSAINSVGTGPPSDVASATTDAVVPGKPTGLAATAHGSSRIDLAWRAPNYDGGGAVTGYQIEVFVSGESEWRILVADTRSDAPEYSHTGLEPASMRLYRVSAINSAGVGAPSNLDGATTDPVVPDAPTDLTATANGTSRIDLAWRAPRYDGGARIVGYRIDVSDNAGASWATLVADTRSRATVFPHVNLPPASTRHYRVSAINAAGTSEPSNIAFATTDATVPNAPARLVAVARDHSQIDLVWVAPDFDGGSRITGYRIEVSENRGANWEDLAAHTGSTNTTHSHTGLPPATMRHYRVSAINEIGVSRPSNVASATTNAVAPDPPTNLVATPTEPTRIDLTWTAPAYDGGAPVTSYRIEVSEDGAAWADLEPSTGTNHTGYAHTGLRPGSTRHYRVSAINIAGVGMPSAVASASTDDPVQRAGRVNRAVLPHFAAAMTTSTLSAISGRIEAVASSRNPLPSQLRAAGLLSLAGQPGPHGPGRGLTTARLLDGASFVLPLGKGAEGQQIDPGSRIGTWGGAEYHSMGDPGGHEIQWEGDMLSVHAGMDVRVHRDFLVGVAGSRSSGSYDFTDVTGEREITGIYEARMASVNPYLAWLPGRMGVAIWVAGGYGWGEVAVEDEAAGSRASKARMMTGALGGTRVLLSNENNALRVRGEGWLSQVQVDGGEAMDSLTLRMQRARFALEWSQVNRFQGGHEVRLMLEGGVRYDASDAMDGTGGMEVGGGLRYSSPWAGLTLEGHGRLLATGSTDYEEWGARGLVQIGPRGGTRGLSMRLVPTWGEATSGVQELWQRGVGDRTGNGRPLGKGRLNAEMEYGLPAYHTTPYGRFQVAQGGARTFGTGMKYKVDRVLDLRLEGTRTENPGGTARHGLAMKGRWWF